MKKPLLVLLSLIALLSAVQAQNNPETLTNLFNVQLFEDIIFDYSAFDAAYGGGLTSVTLSGTYNSNSIPVTSMYQPPNTTNLAPTYFISPESSQYYDTGNSLFNSWGILETYNVSQSQLNTGDGILFACTEIPTREAGAFIFSPVNWGVLGAFVTNLTINLRINAQTMKLNEQPVLYQVGFDSSGVTPLTWKLYGPPAYLTSPAWPQDCKTWLSYPNPRQFFDAPVTPPHANAVPVGNPEFGSVIGASNNFTVCFAGIGQGQPYTIESSHSLDGTRSYASITAATNSNVDADGHLQVPLSFGTNQTGFFRLVSTNIYSGTLGFTKVTIPAGKKMLVASPFSRYRTYLDDIFTSLPSVCVVTKYSGTNWFSITNTVGGWPTDIRLDAGETVMVSNPTGSNVSFHVSGAVPQVYLDLEIPVGYSELSYVLPKAGTLDELGFPKTVGDVVHKYISASGTWTNFNFGYITNYPTFHWETNVTPVGSIWVTNIVVNNVTNRIFQADFTWVTNVVPANTNPIVSVGWSPSVPSLELAEGFTVDKSTNATWKVAQPPSLEVPVLLGIYNNSVTNHFYDYPIPDSCNGVTPGAAWVVGMAMPGTTWRLQKTTSLAPISWTSVTTNVAPLSAVIAVPITISTNAAFYRFWDGN